jgi:hypothetical protein
MAEVSPLRFFLIPMTPATIFTARVTSAPSDPYMDIAYNTGVIGAFGASIPGQTVWIGTTSGGRERGVLRLRNSPGAGSGTLQVAESDDVGPTIGANDYITIKSDFRLWPKYPRFLQSGTQVTIFQDYDVAYTNQTNQWRPIAVAGPPGVAFLEGGQAQISFVGDRSFALSPGATITGYLWTAYNSSEATSTSQGTEASPVVFTWTTPGRHLVSLRVTDSNGNTHTNYTWAVVVDPADASAVAHLDFDPISDSFDFEQGGGECAFTVRGAVTASDFPQEMMVIHAARGTITTATGSWPNRTNILFAGYVLTDTVRQDPETGDVSFRAGTIDALMRNLTMFPVSLSDRASPTQWTQANTLTVDRAASFLWEWGSTLSLMTSIRPTNYTGLIRRQDFGPNDIYSSLQNSLMSSIWGKVVSDHQSVLHHVIDYNLRNAAERATVTTRKTLHKGIWINDVTIEETHDYAQPVNQVKMSGIYYPGGEIEDICPLFSEAPGDAPKVYGKEANFDRLILTSQSDLNVRTGHALAKLTQRYPVYRMQFLNDGSFTTAPQELFPANVEAADNDRGLALTPNLIPRRINRTYDHAGGFFTVAVDFEPETSGPAGITVEMPCGPPEQKLPGTVEPPTPGGIAGLTSIIAGTTGSSFYFAPGLGETFERRVAGLDDPGQIAFSDLIPDPWSTFKQGYNPERVIIWGSGQGFLARADDSGKGWQDRTSYLGSAPNWPGETGTLISELNLFRLQADIFNEDRLYVLARWQRSAAWHSAIAQTDDGFTYTWRNITGTAQVRALGMSLDRGDGTDLYITTWENDTTGTLYLRRYSTADMSLTARYELGGATAAEVDAQTYYANPFNRLGQANEVFIYGRMNAPQGSTGTVHVLLNTSGGATGSYSVIENTWDTNLCGSFGADEDGNYYAVRNG